MGQRKRYNETARQIEGDKIIDLRGQKVILDNDVAALYGVGDT